MEAAHGRFAREPRDLERQLQDIVSQRSKAHKEETDISQTLAAQVLVQEERERETKPPMITYTQLRVIC